MNHITNCILQMRDTYFYLGTCKCVQHCKLYYEMSGYALKQSNYSLVHCTLTRGDCIAGFGQLAATVSCGTVRCYVNRFSPEWTRCQRNEMRAEV